MAQIYTRYTTATTDNFLLSFASVLCCHLVVECRQTCCCCHLLVKILMVHCGCEIINTICRSLCALVCSYCLVGRGDLSSTLENNTNTVTLITAPLQ